MSEHYRYPAELFLGLAPDEPLYGQAKNAREEAFLFLLNGFDDLHALDERRIVRREREHWRYGEGRRFETEADVAHFIEGIVARFRELNERCLALSLEPLFPHPEDAAASYLLRDAMMLLLPEEDAARIVRERETLLREFEAMRASPTLKQIAGKFRYRALMKHYRTKMPR